MTVLNECAGAKRRLVTMAPRLRTSFHSLLITTDRYYQRKADKTRGDFLIISLNIIFGEFDNSFGGGERGGARGGERGGARGGARGGGERGGEEEESEEEREEERGGAALTAVSPLSWEDSINAINIIALIIDLIFIYFRSDHGISGIMPFEVSIIRNKFRSRLCVVRLFLIMDTLPRALSLTHRLQSSTF